MGFGLPAAIGAALARPGRLGVALAGDGGFAMTMAELETAVRERAHILVLVFDNGRYGTTWRQQQLRGDVPGLATSLGPVDFAAIAEACGALGLSVRSDEEFEPALRQALEAGRPALLHLALDPRWTTPDGSAVAEERNAVTSSQSLEALEFDAAVSEAVAEAELEATLAVEVAEIEAELAIEEAVAEVAEIEAELAIEEAVAEVAMDEPRDQPAATDSEPEPGGTAQRLEPTE